jgi:hypothetical protein
MGIAAERLKVMVAHRLTVLKSHLLSLPSVGGAATLNIVSSPLRNSHPATIMPLPRCRIPILTIAGLIELAALHRINKSACACGG